MVTKEKRYWIMELNLEMDGEDCSHSPPGIREEEAHQGEPNNPDDPKQNQEEYLPNPISQQGRSPVSQDLVVFKF
ncbi:hypothetical protein JTB14_027912 [Gonioctena quinquepunctata]|nr:hypothetical protein JTB14_027912 [Gonioctena quinquepunctata]